MSCGSNQRYAAIWVAGTLPFVVLLIAFGESAPLFVDGTSRSKIQFIHQSSPTSHKYLPEAMSGGVAIFDYDGDGRQDIFLVNGAALKDPMKRADQPDKSNARYWNRLYRNTGDGTFSDVTERAGLQGTDFGMGVAAADYDNDGRADLFVTGLNGGTLYHNNADGTFSDVTTPAGVRFSGWSTGAMFVDFDRDGKLDLFVARYLEWDFSMDIFCGFQKPGGRMYCHPDQFQPISHMLFHNEGGGRFKDVSRASGISAHRGKGLGVAMEDYDQDGWPDIFVANDSVAQQVFHNRRDGTFEEIGVALGSAYDADGRTFSGMGLDATDYDNDGWPDIFVNSLATQRYALFRNINGSFDYVSDSTGVGAASMLHSGWGAKFFDFDNDGWKDLFVAQGHVMDNIQTTEPHLRYRETPLLLRNVDGHFTDISLRGGPAFKNPIAARGAAFGDLYNNGAVDVVINVNNGQPVVLENRDGSGNHWLTIEAIGTTSNRDGIGTRIRVVTKTGPAQYAMVSSASSYLSASDKRVHFGLGRNARAEAVDLTWPSGKIQRLEHVAADRTLRVREP